MVDNITYLAVINPVPGLPEAKQREMLAKFHPKGFFILGKDGDYEALAKLIRPPRVVLVVFTGLLTEQHGRKPDRVDRMVAAKVAIHHKGSYFQEAGGRRSDKSWLPMRKDGEEMCRRLSQGAKSAINGRKGTARLADKLSDNDLRDLLRIRDSKKFPNWPTRKAEIKKLGIPMVGHTWFYEKLEHVCRERGIST